MAEVCRIKGANGRAGWCWRRGRSAAVSQLPSRGQWLTPPARGFRERFAGEKEEYEVVFAKRSPFNKCGTGTVDPGKALGAPREMFTVSLPAPTPLKHRRFPTLEPRALRKPCKWPFRDSHTVRPEAYRVSSKEHVLV